VTVVASKELETELTERFVALGASGYTATACRGVGRSTLADGSDVNISQVRLETIVQPDVADRILDYLRSDITPAHRVAVYTETVEVLRQDNF